MCGFAAMRPRVQDVKHVAPRVEGPVHSFSLAGQRGRRQVSDGIESCQRPVDRLTRSRVY